MRQFAVWRPRSLAKCFPHPSHLHYANHVRFHGCKVEDDTANYWCRLLCGSVEHGWIKTGWSSFKFSMSNTDQKQEEKVLRRMLATKPKRHTPAVISGDDNISDVNQSGSDNLALLSQGGDMNASAILQCEHRDRVAG